jgi:hypothetical protein
VSQTLGGEKNENRNKGIVGKKKKRKTITYN